MRKQTYFTWFLASQIGFQVKIFFISSVYSFIPTNTVKTILLCVLSCTLHWLFNHEYSGFLNIVEPQFLWILLMSWSTIKSICHWSQDHLWWVTHLGPFLRLEFTDLLSYPHSSISIKGQLRHKRRRNWILRNPQNSYPQIYLKPQNLKQFYKV